MSRLFLTRGNMWQLSEPRLGRMGVANDCRGPTFSRRPLLPRHLEVCWDFLGSDPDRGSASSAKGPWCFGARWPSPAQYRGWQPEDPGPKFLHAGVRHGEGDAGEHRDPIFGVIWPDPSQWWSGLGAVPWPWDTPIFQVWLSSWPRFPQCVGYCRRWWLVLRVDLQGRTGGTGPLRHPYLDPAGRSRKNDRINK